MTKRLSLWNQQLSRKPRRTEDPESKDSPSTPPSATTAKFYAKHPHLLEKGDPPAPAKEETPPSTDSPLEAGSWESPQHEEPLPREKLPNRRYGKKHSRVPKHKQRRHAVSVAVSEEEERILRTYAAGLDRSFSEWARGVLFRAMGRKVPARSGKDQ